MKQTLLTRHDEDFGYDSIAWAFEVHVKQPDDKRYQFAILYGNEDAPDKIEFYTEAEPAVMWTWKP